jgi:hypothetical protein
MSFLLFTFFLKCHHIKEQGTDSVFPSVIFFNFRIKELTNNVIPYLHCLYPSPYNKGLNMSSERGQVYSVTSLLGGSP